MNFKFLKVWTNTILVKRCYSSEVRVRFAPSPTGFLHLGSIRTALYNFLFAKKHGGCFILRIEDTDQDRVVSGAIEGIERELQWMSLHPDEGPFIGGAFGPYIQSQRKAIYLEKINELIELGHGYRCFCSSTRLELMRKEAAKNREIPKYDNRCRHLSDKEVDDRLAKHEPFTVRLKLTPGDTSFEDIIYGKVTMDLSKVEGDPILMKSDGFPTYHFANVVDDHAMKISHVLRGNEWLNATPKHLMLFKAFGWKPPSYGHLPLILNSDGTKLSKRSDDIRLESMRSKGFLPETIVNYLSRISGAIEFLHHDTVLSLNELVDKFSHKNISSSSNRFDFEIMKALNRKTIQQLLKLDPTRLEQEVRRLLQEKFGDDVSEKIVVSETLGYLSWSQNRINFLPELVDEHGYLWVQPKFDFDCSEFETALGSLDSLLKEVIDFLPQNDMEVSRLKSFCKERNLKYGLFMHFIRCCLTNKPEGPPISEILALLRKEAALERLTSAMLHFSKKN